MASNYPTSLDSFPTGHNVGETILNTDINNLADATNKIEAELGINPSGSFADIATRFSSLGGGGALPSGYFDITAAPYNASIAAADNATAIQTALNDAAASVGSGPTAYAGGCVIVPRGSFQVKSQILVPPFVRLIGVDNRSSKIVAATGFPTTGGTAAQALIRQGSGSSPIFGCRVEHLRVECNSIAATGIYSAAVNESSGVYHCVVNNATTDGIYYTSGASLATIQDCEIANLPGGNSGISIVGVAGPINLLGEITINHGAGTSNTYGVYASSAIAVTGLLHCEHCVNGIYFNSGGGGFVSHYIGHASNTYEVTIGASMSSGIVVIGRIQSSATTATINDLVHSTTITGETGLYQWTSAAGNGKVVVP